MAGSLLNRRAFNRTVAAIHAAVARLGLQALVAVFAYIKILACIGGHGFFFLMSAVGTSNDGLQLYRSI